MTILKAISHRAITQGTGVIVEIILQILAMHNSVYYIYNYCTNPARS